MTTGDDGKAEPVEKGVLLECPKCEYRTVVDGMDYPGLTVSDVEHKPCGHLMTILDENYERYDHSGRRPDEAGEPGDLLDEVLTDKNQVPEDS